MSRMMSTAPMYFSIFYLFIFHRGLAQQFELCFILILFDTCKLWVELIFRRKKKLSAYFSPFAALIFIDILHELSVQIHLPPNLMRLCWQRSQRESERQTEAIKENSSLTKVKKEKEKRKTHIKASWKIDRRFCLFVRCLWLYIQHDLVQQRPALSRTGEACIDGIFRIRKMYFHFCCVNGANAKIDIVPPTISRIYVLKSGRCFVHSISLTLNVQLLY